MRKGSRVAKDGRWKKFDVIGVTGGGEGGKNWETRMIGGERGEKVKFDEMEPKGEGNG